MSDNLRFSPAPRRVPLSLVIANAFNGVTQFGWALFGFGMIFFWAMGMRADLSFLNFRGPLAQASGEIVKVEETGASENKRRIYANYYTYSIAGQRLEGVSYTKGDSATAGTRVPVEYDPTQPTRSRVAGMARDIFGPGILFVVIFPVAGLAVAAGATRMGLKRARLLRDGHLAMGTLKEKLPTNMTVNKQPVYELVFEFTDRSGRRQELRTKTSLTARLEDESQEPLLYDPADPSRAYLLDEAPSRPKFGNMGELLAARRVGLRLALPAIVLGVNALVLYAHLT